MVEMIVQGIRKCARNGQPVLLLREKGGERVVPVGLPAEDARILASELANAHTRQSDVYTLLTSLLTQLGGKVAAVVLHIAPTGELRSCLRVDTQDDHRQMETNPIDALAIALRQHSPVFVNGEALERMSFKKHDPGEIANCAKTENDGSRETNHGAGDDLPTAIREFLSTLDLSGLGSGAN